MIAGGRGLEAVLADVWVLQHLPAASSADGGGDPFVWRHLTEMELPHPRCAHASACVPGSSDLLVCGGFTGMGIAEDVIAARVRPGDNGLEAAQGWRPVEASQPIGGRFGHCMASTCADLTTAAEGAVEGVLLFGGIDAVNDYNDMWALTDFL